MDLTGQIIVSMPSLQDERFYKTVIYMCAHSSEGSMGIIINKKIEVLFDRRGRHKNQYIGRSIYNQSVFIESNRNLIRSIQHVRIKRSTDFALEASLIE